MPTTFRSLEVRQWRQFSEVDIEFHPALTVITGANASGKTTLLGLLGKHFDAYTQLLGVPRRSSSGDYTWTVDGHSHALPTRYIGTLNYATDSGPIAAPLSVPDQGQTYDATIHGQQLVHGLYVSSHRTMSLYSQLPHLPTGFSSVPAIMGTYTQELRQRGYGTSATGRSPAVQMKEALLTAAVYGEGNSSITPNPEAQAIWEGFNRVLSTVLPPTLGFVRLEARVPDLLIETSSNEFLIESMSGGVNAIIELAWLVFLRSREHTEFTVCLDEPENHLHPSLQRSLLPGLLSAFPGIHFVIATHSPFIVTSVPDSNVYVLDYDDTGSVFSHRLALANKAATADETLRRVLGLESTAPLWVEAELQRVLDDFEAAEGPPDLADLRAKLTAIGLGSQFPNALRAVSASEQ